jgi:hypothetical protein
VVVVVGETARDPDTPDGEKAFPVPLQVVALMLDQASVEDKPFGTAAGDAERVAVGSTSTVADWLADPPGPLQVIS